MRPITTGMTVVRNEKLIVQEFDGALAVADLVTGEYYGLETTASHIWALLDGSRTIAEVCAGQCLAEVTEFVIDLQERGLAVVR